MSKPDQTLVILSPAFPADESDTNWLPFIQSFTKELKNQFLNLNIVVLSFNYPEKNEKYQWNKIDVISFNGMHKKKFRRILLWRNIWKQLKKLKREQEVIAILSLWCGECALIGKWFAKRNDLKHFCWICGQDARKSNKIVKWVRPRSNELIAISDSASSVFHESHGIKPAYVIPNAIDKKIFPTFSSERNIDIIGVGSLSVLKNYDQFVSIISSLKKEFPNLKAVLCGDGEDEKNIKKLVKDLVLEKNISLLGETKHEEVLELMQRSKVLLHPSSYEGFSTVCLEALYAGAYVISFTKPMNYDIKNWFVVKTKEEMLEKALELLLKTNLPHERVLVNSMEDSVKALMNLFNPVE